MGMLENEEASEMRGLMKKVLLFVTTVVAAYIGFILGAALNLEGYLGIVFAIAVVGIFLLDAIEKK